MNRDEILEKSRNENKGKYDERQLAALGKASNVGIAVGGLMCMLIALVSEIFFDRYIFYAIAWLVYTSMLGSRSLYLYKELKARKHLVIGILETVCAAAFAVSILMEVFA